MNIFMRYYWLADGVRAKRTLKVVMDNVWTYWNRGGLYVSPFHTPELLHAVGGGPRSAMRPVSA